MSDVHKVTTDPSTHGPLISACGLTLQESDGTDHPDRRTWSWSLTTCEDCLSQRDAHLRVDYVNVPVADLRKDRALLVRIERRNGWPHAGVLVGTFPSYTEASNIASCLNDDDDAPVLS